VPHLGLLIGVRNSMIPAQALYAALMSGALRISSPDDLLYSAPAIFRRAWGASPLRETIHAEVVAFGHSPSFGRVVGFGWQSGDDFSIMEILNDGADVRPRPKSCIENPSADWFATALAQQALDRLDPYYDRDHLGGDLVTNELRVDENGGVTITSRVLGRLPHYNEFVAAIDPKSVTPNASEFERCEPWLAAALEYDTGEKTLADIKSAYLDGKYMLLAGEKSAVLTETLPVAETTATHLYLMGGELTEIRNSLVPLAETAARRMGCRLSLITGRKGWARALASDGYRLAGPCAHPGSWIVGKDLTHV